MEIMKLITVNMRWLGHFTSLERGVDIIERSIPNTSVFLHEPVQGEVSYDSRRGQAPFQIPEKEVVSLSGIVNNKHGSKMLCPNKSNGLNV